MNPTGFSTVGYSRLAPHHNRTRLSGEQRGMTGNPGTAADVGAQPYAQVSDGPAPNARSFPS